MEPERILLVRHAHPAAPAGAFLGRSEVALDAAGEDQARRLAAWMPAHHAVRSLWSSPALRARQTAAVLAERLRLPVHHDDDLREIDFGRWEGSTFAQAEVRDPALVAAWRADEESFCFPDGEAIAAFQTRVAAAAARLTRADAPLVVCHGGVISALLCRWLHLPAAARLAFRPRHAALTMVRWHGEGGVLEAFNSGPE